MAIQERDGRLHSKKIRKGKSKVKTACRTCKIRKVKCDEGRPACSRCISTGRICDGYGIWGGGGNSYIERSANLKVRRLRQEAKMPAPLPTDMAMITTDEQACFQWFNFQTIKKFPGLFPSPFWDTLVRQAILTEPAVLHAVLAFSSAHKKEGIDSGVSPKAQKCPDALEQFTLQQYSHAIGYLQPHFEANSKDSIRVALVTCLIFIYTEFLRGYYRTANTHLQNGLKLLGELQGRTDAKCNDIIELKSPENFVDGCITETFVRLQNQGLLLNQSYGALYLIAPSMDFESSSMTFNSFIQARKSLDRILYEVSDLTKYSFREDSIAKDPSYRHHNIQSRLASWKDTFEASKPFLLKSTALREVFGYQVLTFMHTMATIMANTCLSSTTQSTYDSQLPLFVSLITQAIEFYKIIMSTHVSVIMPGLSADTSDAVAEMSWISPLYYTALKCRNHRVRVQAIRLLKSIPHKEGMWDAMIAASIAKEVVEIEEGGFYKDDEKEDDFELCDVPRVEDLGMEVLPEFNRVHEVQVVLPDHDLEKVTIVCRRRLRNGDWETIVREVEVLPHIRANKPGR